MSATATAQGHDPHADSHGGADHHPHVTPLPIYFGVWGALVVLTIITVAVSRFDFGAANLIVAMAVATIKASLVALFFMHLFWDNKMNSVILVTTLVFLGIFIGFTMFDTGQRGRADLFESDRPADSTKPFERARGGGRPKTLRATPREGHAGAAGSPEAHHAPNGAPSAPGGHAAPTPAPAAGGEAPGGGQPTPAPAH